jgi:hypothetical protein
MTTDDKLAVSQDAREALRDLFRQQGLNFAANEVKMGWWDKSPQAQILARFEAQARAAGERAGMEKAAGIARKWDNITRPSDERQAAREIEAAIRTAASTGEIG